MQVRVVGILDLGSKQRYGYTKKGVPLYRFRPFGRALTTAARTHDWNLATTLKVGYRRARSHAFRAVYAVAEWDLLVAAQNGCARACLVEVLGTLDEYQAGLLAIQYAHAGYKRSSPPPPRLLSATTRSPPIPPSRITPDAEEFAPICCTIDPDGCQDIDDALEFRRVAFHAGNADTASPQHVYAITVSITDVDACVSRGSTMDAHYRRQPCSLYRPDGGVSHALPPALSTQMCSLRAGETRPVLSVRFTVCDDGSFVRPPEIRRDTICSQQQLTYAEANAQFASDHRTWRTFAAVLRAWRNRCPRLHLQSADEAHLAVEFLMIKANEHVAQALQRAVQGGRTEAVLLRAHTTDQGHCLRGESADADADAVRALESMRSSTAARYLVYTRATSDDVCHAGLGIAVYTHFTSPIRRYADLIVHRLVKTCLLSEDDAADPSPYSCEELHTLVQELNAFGSVSHCVASEWEWWHRRTAPDGGGGDCSGDDRGDRVYHGYVLDWACGDAMTLGEDTCDDDANANGVHEMDAPCASSVLTQCHGHEVSILVRMMTEPPSAGLTLHERLRHGVTIWIPLLRDRVVRTMCVQQPHDGSGLVLQRDMGPEMHVRRYQNISVRAWWDMRRGVRGRRFRWLRPDVNAFLRE